MLEKWDIYDQYRRPTGKQMVRGEAFKEGDYHLVIHICLFNEKGEMLIQQRQSDRESWSNMWDVTVGGSAIVGETSQKAAQRELQEEIGVHLDFSDKRPSLTVNFSHGFDDYYLVQTELNISELPLPTEEVKQVTWASKEEIIRRINEGLFIPYYESFIELLFKMKQGMGVRKFDETNLQGRKHT
ncbi:NUDIX hydrolase [Bacillaceae bacterium W0354]